MLINYGGSKQQKSKVIKKELSPTWDESFTFNYVQGSSLELEVRDKDMMSSDFLGFCEVAIDEVLNESPKEYSIALQPKKNHEPDGKDRGIIYFTVTYAAPEPESAAAANPEEGAEGVNGNEETTTIIQEEVEVSVTTTTTTINTSSRGGLFNPLKAIQGAMKSASSAVNTASGMAKSAVIGATGQGKSTGPPRRVSVEVIRGRNLVTMDPNGKSDPYVKLQIGKQKRQTRTIFKSLDPEWKQRFEFSFPSMGDNESILKLFVMDKDTLASDQPMGQVTINLSELQLNQAIDKWYTVENVPTPNQKGLKKNQEAISNALSMKKSTSSLRTGEGPGDIHVVIVVSDLYQRELDPEQKAIAKAKSVGWLKVHVVEAVGLEAKDIMTSDPYCTVRVGNTTLRTDTVKASLKPTWNKLLEMPVNDIFDVVEVCVLDEDNDGTSDFIGGICIPLLELENDYIKWYTLKTENYLNPAKAGSAVRLGFHFTYKKPQGQLGLIKRREIRYLDEDPAFSTGLLKANANRLKAIALNVLQAVTYCDGLLKWQHSDEEAIGAYIAWVLGWWFGQLWMIPLVGAFVMLVIGIKLRRTGGLIKGSDELGEAVANAFKEERLKKLMSYSSRRMGQSTTEEDKDNNNITNSVADTDGDQDADNDMGMDEGEEEEVAQPKKTLMKSPSGMVDIRAQYRQLTNIGKLAQNSIGKLADDLERVKNLFNWSSPMISLLFTAGLVASSIVLFIVPFRILAILWGTNKFVRKGLQKHHPSFKRDPNKLPLNEAVEALRRLPSDVELVQYKPLDLPETLASEADVLSEEIAKSVQADAAVAAQPAPEKSKML